MNLVIKWTFCIAPYWVSLLFQILLVIMNIYCTSVWTYIAHQYEHILHISMNIYCSSVWTYIAHQYEHILLISMNIYCSSVWTYIAHQYEHILLISMNIYCSSVWTYIAHQYEHILLISMNIYCSSVWTYIAHQNEHILHISITWQIFVYCKHCQSYGDLKRWPLGFSSCVGLGLISTRSVANSLVLCLSHRPNDSPHYHSTVEIFIRERSAVGWARFAWCESFINCRPANFLTEFLLNRWLLIVFPRDKVHCVAYLPGCHFFIEFEFDLQLISCFLLWMTICHFTVSNSHTLLE